VTSALVGDEWAALRSGRFTIEEKSSVPIGYETGLFPERVWTTKKGKIFIPTASRTATLMPFTPQPFAIPTALSRFRIRYMKDLITYILMGRNLDISVELKTIFSKEIVRQTERERSSK
jgi:hypothetical protein